MGRECEESLGINLKTKKTDNQNEDLEPRTSVVFVVVEQRWQRK